MEKKPLYLDGVERLNKLRRICPEFDRVCARLTFRTFRLESPDLAVACRIFQSTYCGDPAELLCELDANYSLKSVRDYDYNMRAVCCYLVDFFNASGETECTATVLRWMRERVDCSESEVLRL